MATLNTRIEALEQTRQRFMDVTLMTDEELLNYLNLPSATDEQLKAIVSNGENHHAE